MARIRPLERADLPEVIHLYETVARAGVRETPQAMLDYFERFFFDHPWADPEIPSLVYEGDDGRLVGFLGSSVRRFRFDGRSLRAGCSGQLVTDPSGRAEAPGALLMREYMKGPQELTYTDSASDTVRRIWERLGGETFHVACIGWVRVFRPWQFASAYRHRQGIGETRGRAARLITKGLDAVSVGLARRRLSAVPPKTGAEELTASGLAEHLPEVAASFRLHPDYDLPFGSWLLDEMRRLESRGRLVTTLVRLPDGRAAGWYVYFLRVGGISQVMQIAAAERHVGTVLDHLFHDAASRGAAAVQGRMEPRLRQPLATRGPVLHFSGYLTLLHARDHSLLDEIHSGGALLTRMEGEWWMGHHLPRLGAAPGDPPPPHAGAAA
jgi:hypothetical protein